ncbi:hypothetical protein F5887DRAFT_328620 [Amanita rubescens]|nr:hypothetical protein F5887DRAFT_328620 [Amanita rubescens]
MPLLQAIPLHIDLAKNSVMDALQKQGTGDAKSVQTSPILQTPGVRNSIKRSRAYSRSGDMAASTSQKNKRFCEAREVTMPPSGPSAVCNRNNPDTPQPDSRRPSLRSNSRGSVLVDHFQTPSQKSKAIIDSLTHSKHRSTRPPHISALGDRANTLRPATTEMHTSTDTLSRLTNLRCNTSIQSNCTPPVARPSPSDILAMNRKEANPARQLSVSAVLTSQQTRHFNALKKSSTYMRPPQLETSQPSGTLVSMSFTYLPCLLLT